MFLLGQNATAPRGLDLSAWSGIPLGLDLLVLWRRVVLGPGWGEWLGSGHPRSRAEMGL